MFHNIRLHRIAALLVLLAAGAWIATGHFAAVGTNQAKAEASQAAEAPALQPEPVLRTVAGMTPVFAEHARKIRLSGVTAPDKSATLAARATGVIEVLNLAKGKSVAQGSLVMQLEGPETVANAEIAQIALDQSERDLALAERLFKSGNTPETQVTNARSARNAAAAQLKLAKATVDRLQLKAPFSGTVDSVEVEAGEWVQMGATIATILTLDPILVKAEVSELDVGQVSIGSAAQVTLVNGQKLDGTVRFVAREASAATRTFPVEIAFPNKDKSIPAGMTAKVELLAAPVIAVTVPRSIITLSDQGEIGLRVVGPDDVAQFAAIQVLDDTLNGLVVTGIPQGVRIVVSGQDLVRNGDQVVVDEAAPVSQP
ncbi:MAG: efflux RND transporter periplasmic adaptor subunit [Cypionkella sp.]|nr:efflux RND transporter periplasmic adaptor subunit [Cypionkella sp.]